MNRKVFLGSGSLMGAASLFTANNAYTQDLAKMRVGV
ncbi:MAG: hypothetical protein JWQ78_570 [Sediminibacterium sp.]|nr:hypothetical protein [Sediminibacterium sp.]